MLSGLQERRRRDIGNAAAGGDTIGNDSLIRGDVVRGDVLDGDLLLAPASVVGLGCAITVLLALWGLRRVRATSSSQVRQPLPA